MHLEDYGKIESTNIEFKEKVEYSKPKSWLKSVSAFANKRKLSRVYLWWIPRRKICLDLDNIEPLETPIKAKGQLSIWNYKIDT